MKFKDIKFKEMEDCYGNQDCPDPIQATVKLSNGLEVSVVKHGGSYGNKKGLYEMGVFWSDRMMHVDKWGDQVKGWLKPEDIELELKYLETYFQEDKKEVA